MSAFATVRLVLFAKVRADGKRPVYLRVTYRRKSKHFSLNRQCFPEDWDVEAGRFLKNFPGHKKENDMLRTYEQRAADAIRDMERDGVAFTFERFERAVFQDQGGGANMRFSVYLRALRDEFEQAGRYGNSRPYNLAANAVDDFRPRTALADLDDAWLRAFERWAKSERRMKDGGLSVHLRTMRAACNRAMQDKVMPRTWYPFAAYSLSHLKKVKAKKAAPLEFFRALEKTEPQNALEHLTVDIFLFSFYMRGMNLADIAELTDENLQGGRVVYTRKKTGRVYTIRLNEKAEVILKKYEKGHPEGNPIFPVFISGDLTERQKHDRRKKVARQVNRALKVISERIGFDVPGLSFYTARHSYADILKKSGVSVEVISEALGHSDIRTTDAYLKGFADSVLDDADRFILN